MKRITHTDSPSARPTSNASDWHDQHDGQFCLQSRAVPLSKLTCIASAAIATGIALPILTLDYFLVGIGDYLAALTTTAMAAATIWICLRSLHSNRDAEIRPCEPRGPTSPIATLSLPQQQLPPNPAAKQLPRPANEMPGDTAAASDRSKR
jgi:hypothetical protein